MNTSRLISYIFVFTLISCVDPVFFDIELPNDLPIVISGNISNQPGPYQVIISRSFDVQSKRDLRVPISAKQVTLTDELGYLEELMETKPGVYQTSADGMRGRIGGVYLLRVEFPDGKVYESVPDTLLAPGYIDSLFYNFNPIQNYSGGLDYGFDISVNAHGNLQNAHRYMWNVRGTFKALTHPELLAVYYPNLTSCFPIPNEGIPCNYLQACTGLRNLKWVTGDETYPPGYTRVGPCECCTCWYDIFSNSPTLSDAALNAKDNFPNKSVFRVPINPWYFMYKIRIEVSQRTLTENSFKLFKSVQEQKTATGSLFQPVTGQIPATFSQVSGDPTPVNGIFYASGIATRSTYITPEDIPAWVPVPKINYDDPDFLSTSIGQVSCFDLFPNATNIKPDFWLD